MNTERDGRRGNRRGGSRDQGTHTPVSDETGRVQVPRVPGATSTPGGGQEIQPPRGPRGSNPQQRFSDHPPSGPRVTQPGGFGGESSHGSSGSHSRQYSADARATQPSGGYGGESSASSSRNYGGQTPHTRAMQEHRGVSSASSSGIHSGQPPNEPRANPPRGGKGGFPPGGTKEGSHAPLGSDAHTGGNPIFE